MARFKVAVVNLGYESYQTERDILKTIDADLIVAPGDCLTEEEVIRVAGDADGILVREAPISAGVIHALEACKVIVRYGVGVDNIDLETASERKIYVANIPGYGTEEVSDHAVAMLLACIRNLITRDRNLRKGKFETDINDRIYRTTGKILGIIGYGKIGRAFHRKWSGFLPERTLVFDPILPRKTIMEHGAEATSLETLIRESDYISLHAPLTPENRHVIDEAALKMMKRTAIIINTSRGGLIDENALVRALTEDWILGAGLDVFEREPLEAGHPLTRLSNVILSGHVSWYSKDSIMELQTRGAEEVLRVLSGKPPVCWINKW